MGQLLAGAGKDGVRYEIAVQLLGFTDSALLDEAVDSIAAQDLGSLLVTIDRLIESGHDPRRFAQDLLERLRDLFVIFTIEDEAKSILRSVPDDDLNRMQAQARLIGGANLSRGASVVAEGLNQMRGATSPRLILELICSRIVIGNVDSSELGVLARLERLERRSQIEPPKAPMAKAEPSKVRIAPEVAPKVTEGKPTPSLDIDVTSLRRMWPDVIENVKKKRRLTWSLLSTSAQILAVDENRITIGMMNAGARDSFIRSESDAILADAFNEVTGLKKNIEVVVDSSLLSSANLNQPQRADEDANDKNQLAGAELLMKELGAKVISESEK
jgi:DNA polymerase-3 subunit gamma/tau